MDDPKLSLGILPVLGPAKQLDPAVFVPGAVEGWT